MNNKRTIVVLSFQIILNYLFSVAENFIRRIQMIHELYKNHNKSKTIHSLNIGNIDLCF